MCFYFSGIIPLGIDPVISPLCISFLLDISSPQELPLQPIRESFGLINMSALELPTPTVAVCPRNIRGQWISNTCFPLANAVTNNTIHVHSLRI